MTHEKKSKMAHLGFQEQKKQPPRSIFKAREDSPDSVIFTQESNFSLFSSASGSVDRCSFASDIHDQDHESLVSELSKHLAGHDLHESTSGLDVDPNNRSTVLTSHPIKDREKAKAKDLKGGEQEEDDTHTWNPTKIPFSLALIECQNQQFGFGSEELPAIKKLERQRPVSLDLNNPRSNATSYSPRLGGMKKNYVSSRKLGTFPSPGTPNYWRGNVGIQKGWCSERVPLPMNGNRRNIGAALLPINNGRTLPSKWEDAEKWIFSPFAGDGVSRPSVPLPQTRPKSKSGPLGPPGFAYCSTYSPSIPMFGGVVGGNFVGSSPFSTGVLVADGVLARGQGSGGIGGSGGSYHVNAEPCIMRSASMHGCSSDLSSQSMTVSQGEKLDGHGRNDVATMITCAVSRRDIATQMSPEGSTHSSPKGRPSFSPSSPPSFLPIVELTNRRSSKREVRDVQVDDQVTGTRSSKKHGAQGTEKGLVNVGYWKKKSVETQASGWEVSEATKCISRLRREEAKITAWENLQKAKAEEAIRKLEMKLERKRSSSMDKIMNKLRLAQRKAQDMRSSAVSTNRTRQVAKTSNRIIWFHKPTQMGPLSGCFTCHAL